MGLFPQNGTSRRLEYLEKENLTLTARLQQLSDSFSLLMFKSQAPSPEIGDVIDGYKVVSVNLNTSSYRDSGSFMTRHYTWVTTLFDCKTNKSKTVEIGINGVINTPASYSANAANLRHKTEYEQALIRSQE